MTLERRSVSHPNFDNAAYSQAVQIFDAALDARSITMDNARSLVASMQQTSPVLRESVGTPNFLSTINLLERLSKVRRTASNSDFVDAIPGFAQAVLKDLNGYIEEDPDTYLMPAYRIACSFASTQDNNFLPIVNGIFNSNFNRFLGSEEITNREAEELVKHIIATANPQQIRNLARIAVNPDSALSRRFPRQIDSILNLSILGNNTYERPARMAAILDEFTGEQSTKVLNAWDDSQGKKKERSKGSEAVYFDHFNAVCKLEQKRPGITKYLIDRYGILAFARYPLDVLIEQFDTRDEKNVPYITLVAARHDHNGALLNVKDNIAQAHSQSKALGYRLKVCESENLESIVQATNALASQHGKISCALLVGHELGAGLSELEWNRDVFASSAIVGLISCFTGARNGTAQLLSSKLKDVDIHAPDYAAYLKKNGLLFEKVNGELKFKALFGYDEGNFITEEDILYALTSITGGVFNIRHNGVNLYDVPTRVYKNGQLVADYV